MSVVRYTEVLLEKALHCGHVYDELSLKGAFIEVLHKSTHFSMRTFWGTLIDVALRNLARYVASLSKIQEGNISSSTRSNIHGDVKGQQNQLLTHLRREKATPVISIEERHGPLSSSLLNEKASKRSKRRKFWKIKPLKATKEPSEYSFSHKSTVLGGLAH